jgi:4-amino-4-deoxy-L-arabinose transferase-like glycosyltransferase
MRSFFRNTTAWGLLLVGLITFFVNNRLITPDIMESRNIITAREMVHDGHWLIPTMNGDIRLEKPPLPTWLTAVAEAVAPDHLGWQRGMAGLAALLLMFYFYRFADRILRLRPAWVPTLLLCTCYNVILMGRTASWDIYCHAFMMAGIYHFACGYRAEGRGARSFLLAGLWTALSLLSKGPVSPYALFLPFLIALRALEGGTLRGKAKSLVAMTVVALALGCSWYAYIHLCAPEALEQVARKESGSWLDHNVRPWWYYWQFFLEGGIWAVLLLTATLYPALDRSARRWRDSAFAWQWMLWSLLLLSLMPEKKTRYLLPLLVPASLLMGSMLLHWGERLGERWPRRMLRLNGWLLTVVVAALPVAAWVVLYGRGTVGWPGCLGATLVAEVVALWLGRCTLRLQPRGLVVGVTALFLYAECFVLPACKPLINYTEGRSIAQTRTMTELEGLPFCYDATEPLRIELVYAAHRQIRPVDLTATDSLVALTPCVLLTHGPAAEALPAQLLARVDTVALGLFDDNRRPKGSRRYSNDFIYHLTLLRERQTDTTLPE